MLWLFFFLVILLLGLVFFLIFLQIYTRILQPGAIYFPTTSEVVEQMLKLGKVNPKDTLIDLGSGDGRILIAAARLGAKAIGYEINPFLVRRSRRLIHQAKLEKLAEVYWRSFWKADFSQATVVSVYLFPNLMKRLERLLEKKVNHPLRVVSNNYPFPQKKPVKCFEQVYLYHFNN
ncbi:SAM-dependent methyltransferase [Candidatus Shapirobacteria bacterium]|nr:SAM-dependent methyltransferase [Candidatus Shapirobacteria bacterium]